MEVLNEQLGKADGFGFVPAGATGTLKKRYVMPPMSIWNTRDGDWQTRKRQWGALGIRSEVGRAGKLTYNMPMGYDPNNPRAVKDAKGQTSIFDPVVCELCYTWWCPPGGVIVDPFAGGSVRGIVASMLGYRYWGCDLRAEQIEANNAQAVELREQIMTMGGKRPRWVCGDSAEMVPTAPDADFIFTCPPYGDLEVYSDDPADLSNMAPDKFFNVYYDIIQKSVERLRDNRFAVWVVGNYRDKADGRMRDFVGSTINAHAAAGARYYNDIVLVNSVATGALRADGNMARGAGKVVKCHQNVLVFVKGDPRAAAALLPYTKRKSDE